MLQLFQELNCFLVQRLDFLDNLVADVVFAFVLVISSICDLRVQCPNKLKGFLDETLTLVLAVDQVSAN